MKEVAALALVIFPLGMTIMEILAAGDPSPARDQDERDNGGRASSGRKTKAASAAEESRTWTRRRCSLHASGAPEEHAAPGKHL